MTFVPVAGDGHQSALVWCLSNETADHLAALSDEAFLARVQLASQGVVGAITGVSSRAQFPCAPWHGTQLYQRPLCLDGRGSTRLASSVGPRAQSIVKKDAEVAGDLLGKTALTRKH